MVKPPKRASKRQSTKQRAKITKKVREHHRKSRRDAKRSTQWKSKQKEDPGIPNSFPYKEQLLDEMKQRKEREEQRRLELREKRAAERRRGGAAGDDEEEDSEEGDEEEEIEVELDEEAEEDDEDMEGATSRPRVAPLYAGPLTELLDDAEVKHVVFALDARDPAAWRCKAVERLAASKGKQVHLVLTRADLVPLEALASHLHALNGREGKASSSNSPNVVAVSAQSKASIAALADNISKKAGGVAVLGLEHSGRTQLAKALLTDLSERESTSPAAVYDTAHLVAPRRTIVSAHADESDGEEDAAALPSSEEKSRETASSDHDFLTRRNRALVALLRNKGKVERIGDPVPLVWALMPLVQHNEDLMFLYNVPAFGSGATAAAVAVAEAQEDEDEEDAARLRLAAEAAKTQRDASDFLIGLARQQGRARKGGLPDVSAAARVLLRDWAAGCVAYYSYAPGWTKLDKATRASLVEKAGKEVAAEVTLPRREWKKKFAEEQKARRDLHASPAVGEVRLRSAGEGAIAKGAPVAEAEDGEDDDAAQWELWAPRAPRVVEEDWEDEDEDEDDEDLDDEDTPSVLDFQLGSDDEDEELDSDALVPSGAEDEDDSAEEVDDDDEMADEDDDEEEDAAAAAAVSHKDRRKQAKDQKKIASALAVVAGAAGAKPKAKTQKRVRLVEPTRAEKRGRRS